MISADFSSLVLEWYQQNKRDLPWRQSKDAYYIWLSEIILQQTRVAQGLPYYQKFVEEFPTLNHLAAADEARILRLWQGLGYYSRARNMHKCARLLVDEYNSQFPTSYKELLKLPGVGRYTAAAIASLAFGAAVPTIDGNVYRVLARIFGVTADVSQSSSFNIFFRLAENLIDLTQPGDFNQAMMEFGATVCTPRVPTCSDCIFNTMCEANLQDKQGVWPIKTKKIKRKTRFFNYLIVRMGNKMAMRQRPKGDIWQGLYEFYLIESGQILVWNELESDLLNGLGCQPVLITELGEPIKHVLTHQTLFTNFIEVEIEDTPENRNILSINGLTLYDMVEIDLLAKPVLITNYLNKISISINL